MRRIDRPYRNIKVVAWLVCLLFSCLLWQPRVWANCSCQTGYPYTSTNPLTSISFNESSVLAGFNTNLVTLNDTIKAWYSDEHALLLGVRQVIVKTATGSTTNNYPVAPLLVDPSGVTNPAVGTMATSGDQAGTDIVGRPAFPCLFITDITTNSAGTSGDWQWGGTPIPPHAVFGSWKAAVRTVDKTQSPAAVSIVADADPTKNDWNLAGGDPAPANLSDQGYGAEVRWNIWQLGLLPGHSYRLYFMVHDGDQNQSGGDAGQGCLNLVVVSATGLVSQTNCPGDTVVFSTTVYGITSYTLQWLKNGQVMAGQTNVSLTLKNVSLADAATYAVTINNPCGSVTNSATLTINNPVVVTTPPASQTVCPGANVSFSVTATGTGLAYQWYKNNNMLSGQTATSLGLSSISASDAATYSVVVSGTCGNPVTNSATLTVNSPVQVLTPPASQSACPGANVTFSVAATGTGLTYQWYKNNSALSGQTAASLALTKISASDAASYSVVVNGACGSPVTNSASLTVNSTVLVVNAPSNQTVCPGANVTFSVSATGTGLSYQWYKSNNMLSGQTAPSLALSSVSASDAATYRVVVSGTCGNPVTNSATLTVNSPVLVTTPPANQTVCPGANVTFSVSATGTGLSYQWYKNNSTLSGQTAASLTLTKVSGSDAATYSVVVNGTCGSPVTNSATLTVNDTLPTISCPATVLVSCASAVPAPATDYASFVAQGGSAISQPAGPVTVSFISDVTNNLTCDNRFTITRTYKAVDSCGNSQTCAQTITVDNTNAPTISCPAAVLVSCASAVPPRATNYTSFVAQGGSAAAYCGGPVTVSFVGDVTNNQTCDNSLTITRTYQALDHCGNSQTCAQTITVNDTTAPVIKSIPADVTVQCASAVPTANPAAVIATDNCGGTPTITSSDQTTPGTCINNFVVTRTYTATDACGNSSSQTQTITVNDTTAPVIKSIPADVTVQCASAVPAANTAAVLATDNCGGTPTITSSDQTTPGTCINNFVVTRTYTATDECGNSSSKTQTITVNDTTAPVITSIPADVTVQCASAVPTPNTAAVVATDNCGGTPTITSSDQTSTGSCLNKFVIKRTYTATDECGNSSSQTQNITVNDNTAPVITSIPADVTVQCASAVPAPDDSAVVATDNCGGTPIVTSSDQTNGTSCANNFVIKRTYTATDACGNSSSQVQTITIDDTAAPVITSIPADVTVQCASAVPAANTAAVVATDNCGGTPAISSSDQTTPGTCLNNFVVTRTYTATDACGNSSSQTQTITVNDTTAPVIKSIPADVTVQCASAVPAANPAAVVATDNCGGTPTISSSDQTTPGTCLNNFVVTRTYTATDECGNSSSQTQTITVHDTTAPVITSIPADVTVQCASAVPAANPAAVVATDNCGGTPTITSSDQTTAGSCLNKFVIKRTYTATDECGNSSSQTQNITVNDTIAPVITSIPADVTVQCASAVPTPNTAAVVATDNCGGTPTITSSDQTTAGSCLNKFVIKRTYTATDECGNSSSQTQNITVNDNTAPVITSIPADVTVQCASAVPAPDDSAVVATDNCGGTPVVTSNDQTNGTSCANNFVIKRTYTATDACGNSSTQVQTITIDDTTAPVITSIPTDVTVQCASAVPAANTAAVVATDNCGGTPAISSSDQTTPGTCLNNFVVKRTYTATDACGNSSSQTQTITVHDTTAPVIKSIPADVTVQCASAVPAADTAAVVATDNCGGTPAISSSDQTTPGTCLNNFVVKRTYTATDECGNSSSQTQNITVNDTIAPVITSIPADVTVQCASAVPTPNTAAVVATDNCGGTPTITSSDQTTAGSCLNKFVIKRTYTATDECGNSSSQTQTITVNDTIAPVITSIPADVTVQCASAVPAPNGSAVVATDNCGGTPVVTSSDQTNGTSCANNFVIKRTYTATDACGNSSTQVQTITIDDTTPPVITSIPADVTVQCASAVPAANTAAVVATDNCGGTPTISSSDQTTPGTCLNNFVVKRTYTATDACGNSSSKTQTITVNDTTAPVIKSIPADVTVQCASAVPAANTAAVVATDNCGGTPIISSSDQTTAGSCLNNFVVKRTYTATDACGNSSGKTQTITVNDNTAPVITSIPADVTVQCAGDVPVANDAAVVATDNCGGTASISHSDQTNNATCANNFVLKRTYTATDQCGNHSSQVQTITVHDTIPPVVTPPANSTIACTDSLNPASNTVLGFATAVDNCSGASTPTYSDQITAGNCAGNYTVKRTWSSRDGCGNLGTAVQTITVRDVIPPIITVPANVTVECGSSTSTNATGVATATDGCSGATVTYADSVTNLCGGTKTISRTWTATDGCGNASSAVQTIKVVDTTPPSLWFSSGAFLWHPRAWADCNCQAGYPYTSTNPLTSVSFNESSVLAGYDTNLMTFNGTIKVWYSDEHALLLGVRQVIVKTASGSITNSTTNNYTVSPLSTDPSGVAYPSVGTMATSGDQAGTDTSGRPAFPCLFITDITTNSASTSGDWQWGGTPIVPHAVFGSWKAAVRTVDKTKSPAVVTVTPDSDPAKNDWNLAGGDPAPAYLADQGYGAEARWNISQLGLIPGHNYRMYFMVHDGDQNNSGGDAGQGCINLMSTAAYGLPLSLGTAGPGNFAVLQISGAGTAETDSESLSLSNAPPLGSINGNVGSANTSSIVSWTTNFPINGTVYLGSSVTANATTVSDAVGGVVQTPASQALVLGAAVDARTAAVTAAGLATIGGGLGYNTINLTNPVALTLNPGVYNLTDFKLSGGAIVTLSAGGSYVFNISGTVSLNSASILTAPGLSPGDVLFNITGTQTVQLSGQGSVLDGIILAPNANVSISPGLVNGEIISGENITIVGAVASPGGSSQPLAMPCTYNPGDWSSGGTVSQLLQSNYATVFPNGLTLGIYNPANSNAAPNGLLWQSNATGLAAFQVAISQGSGSGAPISQDALNPTATYGAGGLGRQTLALTLNLGLDASGLLGGANIYGGLIYTNGGGDSLNGMTVNQILAVANQALAGLPLPNGYDFTGLSALISNLNLAFEGCVQSSWSATHLSNPPFTLVVECPSQVPPADPTTLSASDTCSSPVTIYALPDVVIDYFCSSRYTLQRVWVAQDACGNTNSLTCFIQVSNSIPPILTSPANLVLECPANTSTNNTGVATAQGVCGIATVSYSDVVSNTCGGSEIVYRTWSATDGCNATSAVQTITVRDTTPPVVTPPANVTIACTDSQDPSVNHTLGLATAVDTCSGASTPIYSDQIIAGKCAGNYTVKRTWNSTDACGNTGTAVQTITVQDIVPPVITSIPADVTVQCASAVPMPNTAGVLATDNCSGPPVITSKDQTIPGACVNKFVIKRTYTATDTCGNSSSQVQTITVNDTTAPVITSIPADVTVQCASAVPAAKPSAVIATDNCGGTPVIASSDQTTAGSCVNNFVIKRTYTATDACGNSSSQVQTITVNDTTAPVITSIPADVTVQCASAVPAANTSAVVATDNCGGTPAVSSSDQTTAGSCINKFVIKRTYTVTDACGNSSSQTQTITVNDTTAPVITSIPANVTVQCASAVPAANIAAVVATDNCGGTPVIASSDQTTTGSCVNQFIIKRTYTATDACGNSSSQVQTITVADTTAPVITSIPADVTVQCASAVPAANTSAVVATDNCGGIPVITSRDQTPAGTCANNIVIKRIYTATDACGNSSSQVQTITVADTTAPVITSIPADVTVQCASAVPAANTSAVVATDNCGGTPVITSSDQTPAGTCANNIVIKRAYTATDACGNSSSQVQTITVNDTTPPVIISIPADVTVQCASAVPAAKPSAVVATDNCGGTPVITSSDQTTAGSCVNNFVIKRTYTATDACGNSSSQVQTITVNDTTAPVITSIPADVTVQCASAVPVANTSAVAATDNCGGTPVIASSDQTTAGSCLNNFVIKRTYTVTDACGNSSSQTQTIKVDDTIPPVVTAAANITIPCTGSLNPSVNPALGVGTAVDNCSGTLNPSYSDRMIPGKCAGNYTVQRTWSAQDACGNVGTALQTITVQDTTPPLVVSPPNLVLSFTADTSTNSTGVATAQDACDSVTLSYSDTATILVDGSQVITRIWTATDACGNSASAPQTITLSAPTGLILPVQTNLWVTDLTTLLVTNTATNSNVPANPLVYELINPPTGASIDTNGIITWTPTLAQSPSTNVITTVVTTTLSTQYGTSTLSVTNSFVVIVTGPYDGLDMLVDSDGDGLTNLVEYAVGSDPLNPTDANSRLIIYITQDSGNHYLAMKFSRRTDAAALQLQYLPEVSADKVAWFSDPNHVLGLSVTPLDAQFDWVTVRDTTPITVAEARFIRLHIISGALESFSPIWIGSDTLLQGDNLTLFSQRMVRPILSAGTVASMSSSAITDTHAAFVAGEFGTNGMPAYVELDNGAMIDIANTTANSVALAAGTAGTVGEAYRIRAHFTVASLFGTNNETGLVAGPNPSKADNILLVTPQTQQTVTLFYYSNPSVTTWQGWVRADTFTPDGNEVVYPEQGLMVRRIVPNAANLYLCGPLKTGVALAPVQPGYNLLGTLKSLSTVTLSNLGLYTGDSSTGVVGGLNPSVGDNLVVVTPNGSVMTYFYYYNPGIYQGWVNANGFTLSGGVQIAPGSAFFINRQRSGGFIWTIPAE